MSPEKNIKTLEKLPAGILLGGNGENTLALFASARLLLEKAFGTFLATSSIHTSPAWGYESDAVYFNQLVEIETSLHPEVILENLLAIETSLGRLRPVNNGTYTDRDIDLDLLYIGNLHYRSATLDVPHPRLHLRNFALCPIQEIHPDWIHPVSGKPVDRLLSECPDASLIQKIA